MHACRRTKPSRSCRSCRRAPRPTPSTTSCMPTPTSSGRQPSLASSARQITTQEVPNIADVYPYAVSDKIVGVSIFTSAIGLGSPHRQGADPAHVLDDLAADLARRPARRLPHPRQQPGPSAPDECWARFYGKGFQDLDAAYKALEALKPIKLFDFTGQMEKALLSGEVTMGVIHDSGIFRYDGQNQPTEFAPRTRACSHSSRCWNVTPGSKVKELAYAYIDYMLRPDVQKELARRVRYSPSNRKVKLGAKYDAKLFQHGSEGRPAPAGPLEVVQFQRRTSIDARVQRILLRVSAGTVGLSPVVRFVEPRGCRLEPVTKSLRRHASRPSTPVALDVAAGRVLRAAGARRGAARPRRCGPDRRLRACRTGPHRRRWRAT